MSDMIVTDNLTRTFRNTKALDGLTLSIPKGEVFGFIGPNGAGKTTTIRILATLLTPTRGRAFLGDIDVVRRPDSAKRIMGYMPDHIGIYDDMLVEEYLHFFAAAYRIHGKKREKVVDDVLALTDLGGKRDAPVRALSRGMSQRLGLARVLLHDPEVLLLDEPAAGLDPRARIEFKELIAELRGMGKTVFISSHILAEIAEMCTSIGIIEAGRLLYSGPIEDVKAQLSKETGRVLRIRVTSPEARDQEMALDALRNHPLVSGIRQDNGFVYARLKSEVEDASPIAADLVRSGFALHHFSEEEMNLEEVFMRITKGDVR
ncbi:MAG: ABC transporter ATP-binding protein [Planctomycetota bacterium]